jgi:hypothetical protein
MIQKQVQEVLDQACAKNRVILKKIVLPSLS